MTDYAQEHATEARWRAIVARSEGRPGVAGAWESAAEAWIQDKANLADSLEREAGRMQFAAEVRSHITVARSSLEKEMEQEEDDDFMAGFLFADERHPLEETWEHVAAWAEDNPVAADTWADVQVFADKDLMYAETRWRLRHPSSDFSEILTNWIRAAKARLDARMKFEKSRNDLKSQSNDADKQQVYRYMSWGEAAAIWRRANEARTVGHIEEAAALEYIAGSWEHAAASPTVRKIWYVLNQLTEARDAGRAEVALAWERAAQGWREGNEKLAEAWERAAFELEEALAEEEPAEHPDSE